MENDVQYLTDSEMSGLIRSKSEQEWNSVCDAVKKVRGGQYPPDWYAKVILSGVAAQTQRGWK